MFANIFVPNIDFPACAHLHCPACGFEYNHVGLPVRIDGGLLGCRDDSRRGGFLIPISCENGHEWGLGFANHKGYEVMTVFTPDEMPDRKLPLFMSEAK
jgi:hypothetical protein